MRLWFAVAVLAVLALLAACAGDPERPPVKGGVPTTTSPPSGQEPTRQGSPAPSGEAVPEAPHRVSLPTLMRRSYAGGPLRLGQVVLETATQTQYDVTYASGDLTISGRLAVPKGRGPFPAIALAHGYIEPAAYAVGQGMTREREWLADHGYVVLHVDYRGHGASDPDPTGGLDMRLGYTEDLVNAVLALRRWDGPVDDSQMAVGGRSMGGGVVYNLLAVVPGLVDAAVVWAPVSSDAVDNFDRWIRPDPARSGVADAILRRYGEPRANPDFWAGISARTYFDRVTEPVLIHHGDSDDTCPIRWSRATARLMDRAGVDVTLAVYGGEEHAFGPQFLASMESTDRFLRQELRTP